MEKNHKRTLVAGACAALLAGMQLFDSNQPEAIDAAPIQVTADTGIKLKKSKVKILEPVNDPTQEVERLNQEWSDQLLACLEEKLVAQNEGLNCEKKEITVDLERLDPNQSSQTYNQIHCEGDFEVHSYLQPVCDDVTDLKTCQVRAISSVYTLTFGADTNLLANSLATLDPWGELDLTTNNSRTFTPKNVDASVEKSCEDMTELWEMMKEDGGFKNEQRGLQKAQKELADVLIEAGLNVREHEETYLQNVSYIDGPDGVGINCYFTAMNGGKILWTCAPTWDSLNSLTPIPSDECVVSGFGDDVQTAATLAACSVDFKLNPYRSFLPGPKRSEACDTYLEALPKIESGEILIAGDTEEYRAQNLQEFEENCK